MMRYHYTPIRMSKNQNTTLNAGEDVEQQKLSFIAGGNAKWHGHLKLNTLLPYDPAIAPLEIYPN